MAVWALLQEELVTRKRVLTNQQFLEGAVLGDIQLMMIGPAWLLANLYKRLGIPI